MGTWRELSVRVPRRDFDRLSSLLFEAGGQGVQEDYLPGQAPAPRQPWDVGPEATPPAELIARTWLEDPDEAAIQELLRDSGVPDEAVTWADHEVQDWQARFEDSFQPLVISDRLVIAPPWNAPEGAILIEPGQGFGTGEHPTTRQALIGLDALIDQVDFVLDIGCGSGVLALAAARLGVRAVGVDIDADAIRDAQDNARRNGLSCDFSTTALGDLTEPAPLVLANLYAEMLVRVQGDLLRLTSRWLVLAGILVEREGMVTEAFASLRLHERRQDGEWVSLVYERTP